MIVQSRPTISYASGAPGSVDELVVAGDHVPPPGLLDVPLQLDAQRTVVPKAVEAAVDFARLKQKSPPFAQRNQFFHVHDKVAIGMSRSRESSKQFLKLVSVRFLSWFGEGGTINPFRPSARFTFTNLPS